MLARLVVWVALRPSNMKYYDIERCWDLKTLSPLLFDPSGKLKIPTPRHSRVRCKECKDFALGLGVGCSIEK